IVGGGMTSPDTLLPNEEALVRDYLLGSLFAERALGTQVRTAWVPDSFGHSAALPDLLSAMGIGAIGFGRADGARDPFEVQYEHLLPDQPGSTAGALADAKSADFVWTGPGGGELLAHFMPVALYCQGDTIDLQGLILPGGRVGIDRTHDPAYTNAQI